MLNFLMHFVTVRLWAFLSNWKKDKKGGQTMYHKVKMKWRAWIAWQKCQEKKLLYNFGSKDVIRGGQAIHTSCKWDQRHLFKIIDFELDLFSITTNKRVKSGKLLKRTSFLPSLRKNQYFSSFRHFRTKIFCGRTFKRSKPAASSSE